jgi:hypothetical protein
MRTRREFITLLGGRGGVAAGGRLMLTVLGSLAEFERELIRARTGESRKAGQGAWCQVWPSAQADSALAPGGTTAPCCGRDDGRCGADLCRRCHDDWQAGSLQPFRVKRGEAMMDQVPRTCAGAPRRKTPLHCRYPRTPRMRVRQRPTRTCCGTAAAMRWPTPATTRGRCRRGSATKKSSTRCVTPSWSPTGSRTFGDRLASAPASASLPNSSELTPARCSGSAALSTA